MLHFRRVIASWTDPSLGNCSYLDTCRHMKTCKYIHYELDDETQETGNLQASLFCVTSVVIIVLVVVVVIVVLVTGTAHLVCSQLRFP